MSMFGIARSLTSTGLSLVLPLWATKGKKYDVGADAMRTGWWLFAIRLSLEALGVPGGRHGLSLRLTWAWMPR